MKRTYPVEVKILSALHINGGTDVNGNRITVKVDNKAYIPATLFKGLVRENFTKLWSLVYPDTNRCVCDNATDARPCGCMPCRMFGTAGFQRSRIYFDNLETHQNTQFLMRSNISIDRHLRNKVDQALVFTEVAAPIAVGTDGNQEQLIFKGDITIYYPPELDAKESKNIEAIFVEAVRMITNIGLGKSRGLGFAETHIGRPEGGWLCEKE